jgi:hypothetical protein
MIKCLAERLNLLFFAFNNCSFEVIFLYFNLNIFENNSKYLEPCKKSKTNILQQIVRCTDIFRKIAYNKQ